MKKILLFVCTLFLVLTSLSAQKLDSVSLVSNKKLYDYYWQKHKSRAKTGWILLGTGLAATVGGLFLLGEGLSDYPSIDLPVPVTLAIGAYGIGATLTSFPFFIWAGDNKRKARLALKGEAVTMGNKMLYKPAYPALSVAIPL